MQQDTSAGARNWSIELLRMAAMGMIVFQHLITHSDILNFVRGGAEWHIWTFLYAGARVAVNCFVLVTGFYFDTGTYKKKKVISLWGKTLFYSVGISVIFLLTGNAGIKDTVKNCIPVITKEYWFITVYLVLYIFSPYINRLLKDLEKKEFQRLIVIMTVVFVIWKTVFPFLSTLDDTGGFGLLWFIYLYVLGAWLKKYWDMERLRRWIYLAGYIGCTGIVYLSKIVLLKAGFTALSDVWYGYNTFFMLGASLSLFLFFASSKKEKATFGTRVIQLISPVVLDIYLISEQSMVREALFTDWLKVPEASVKMNAILFMAYSLACVAAICISALAVGKLREYVGNKAAAIWKNLKKT